MTRSSLDPTGLEDRLVQTNKVQKTHKGGRTMSWNALVVVGDRNGRVGAGLGKARAIPDAVRKATEAAKKNLIEVPRAGTTIPHEVLARHGAAQVLLKPASPGTGIVAGSSVRTILELAGISDVLGKSLGSSNAINIAWATIRALQMLKRPEEVAALRGKRVKDLMPWYPAAEEEEQGEETYAEA